LPTPQTGWDEWNEFVKLFEPKRLKQVHSTPAGSDGFEIVVEVAMDGDSTKAVLVSPSSTDNLVDQLITKIKREFFARS
jgi:hypothetical protein